MAKKILGQVAPSATTNTDLYIVPAGKSTVCSTISVCNQSVTTVSYRIATRPAGEAISQKSYLIYDAALPALSTDMITIGVTLAATDVVTVYASAGTLSFQLYGDES